MCSPGWSLDDTWPLQAEPLDLIEGQSSRGLVAHDAAGGTGRWLDGRAVLPGQGFEDGHVAAWRDASRPGEGAMAGSGYAFIDRQIALVGDQEPLDILQNTPAALRRIVVETPRDMLLQGPAASGWRPVDILAHLADMEWVFGFRARHILCDPEPRLLPVEQDAWVARQRHHGRCPDELVATFATLRGEMVAFWRRLTPEDFERRGEHAGAGLSMSLAFLRRLQAGHDLNHLSQLRRTLDRIPTRHPGT